MSVEASGWAWRQPIGGNRKLVLLALADHADHEGVCWPGQSGIAAKTGVSRSTVQDALKWLVSNGLVQREERVRLDGSQTSNRYVLLLDSPRPDSGHPPARTSGTVNRQEETSNDVKDSPDATHVGEIFTYWLGRMSRAKNTLLTPERDRCVRARLREGYTVERIRRAIDGCAGSDFHMGRHEKTRGRPQNDLTLICRNGSKLEAFEAMPPPGDAGGRSAYDRVDN